VDAQAQASSNVDLIFIVCEWYRALKWRARRNAIRTTILCLALQRADDPVISEKLIGLVRQVESNFRAAGYDPSNFRFVVDPEALHTEAAWGKRLPGALTFLFGEWKPAPPTQP